MSDNDFDVTPDNSGVTLKRLSEIAEEALTLTAYIVDLEQQLKEARSALHVLRTTTLPEAMLDARVDDLTVGTARVTLATQITGSWPKEEKERKKAVKYLEKLGQGGLIKTKVEAAFGRSERELALEFAKKLGEQADVHVIESVHHQTLTAFARKRLESGEPLALDRLGLSTFQIATVKPAPKQRKGKVQ